MESALNQPNPTSFYHKSTMNFFVVIMLCSGLAACGGGGGSTISDTPAPVETETAPPATETSPPDTATSPPATETSPPDTTTSPPTSSPPASTDDNDSDNIANGADNCPDIANTDQNNQDNDREGDACDSDDDNDSIVDTIDNCPLQANTNQTNTDGDNSGDICDDDDDNDGVEDLSDNCPVTANSDQADNDNDDIGDVCDGISASTPPQVIRLDQFRSNITDQPLVLQIYLPENYNPTQTYPVMYVLDDIAPRIAAPVNAGRKQVILVMVNGWDRNSDFTTPGAATSFNVLVNEVLPVVESQYLIDGSQRSLAGWSLGGLFAGLVMLLEDPNDRKFQNYVAFDGSFWSNPSATNDLISQLAAMTNTLPASIFLSGAGNQGNDAVVRNFRDALLAQNFRQLNVNYEFFPFAGHGGTTDPYAETVINLLYQ